MYFPVRCFTCGTVLGDKWEDYEVQVKAGKKNAAVLDSLGVERYCCRRMFISHVEVMDKVVKYGKL